MDNLKYYLRECALPDLSTDGNLPEPPFIGHKSHKNHLAVRPETWRRLETICPLADTIDNTVASCMKVDVVYSWTCAEILQFNRDRRKYFRGRDQPARPSGLRLPRQVDHPIPINTE